MCFLRGVEAPWRRPSPPLSLCPPTVGFSGDTERGINKLKQPLDLSPLLLHIYHIPWCCNVQHSCPPSLSIKQSEPSLLTHLPIRAAHPWGVEFIYSHQAHGALHNRSDLGHKSDVNIVQLLHKHFNVCVLVCVFQSEQWFMSVLRTVLECITCTHSYLACCVPSVFLTGRRQWVPQSQQPSHPCYSLLHKTNYVYDNEKEYSTHVVSSKLTN